jgi:arginyl-tRNA synthetase
MNPNKELHVGHLRNSCIGQAMVNLLKYSGRDVIVQYYQNDAGLQISSIVLAYKEKFVDPSGFTKLHKWAAEAYVDIEKRLEDEKNAGGNGDLLSKRDQIQSNIASQDNEDAKLAKELTDEILRNVLEVMSEFGIYFDLIVCESEILKNKIWDAAFEILKKSPAFYQSKDGEKAGCWLVKMPNAEDKIFVRSSGIPNYVATDFAYEMWKFGLLPDFKYEPFKLPFYKSPLDITSSNGVKKDGYNQADEVYLVIDTTQSYPQQSIVEALKVLGYKQQSENYHHIAYGFVYLSDKTAAKLGVKAEDPNKPIKMSGRSGTVVSVDTFTSEVEKSLVKKFGEFSGLRDVRNGAIKFEMLKNNTYQDMVFDLDSAIDNKGFSGPYIQYTHARALSVLRKSKTGKSLTVSSQQLGDINEDEKRLLKEINRLPEEINFSIAECSPHYMCHYMYSLSQAFNAFYNSNKIIGSERENERLAMAQSVANSLYVSLGLLGIEAPISI